MSIKVLNATGPQMAKAIKRAGESTQAISIVLQVTDNAFRDCFTKNGVLSKGAIKKVIYNSVDAKSKSQLITKKGLTKEGASLVRTLCSNFGLKENVSLKKFAKALIYDAILK